MVMASQNIRRLLRAAAIAATFGAAAACASLKKPPARLAYEIVPAAAPSALRRLTIVLPGVGDSLATLRRSGAAAAIQRGMPDADVMLVELSLPYYLQGQSAQRLHDEIVSPARQRGYREIYLAGASLGGMGVLAYERAYPNDMRGLVLMAPFMGDGKLLKAIQASGGLMNWQAPTVVERDANAAAVENWRLIQAWTRRAQRASDVWLICGQSDRFYAAAELIAERLPPDHYVSLHGGHQWTVWLQGAEQAFAKIAMQQTGSGLQ